MSNCFVMVHTSTTCGEVSQGNHDNDPALQNDTIKKIKLECQVKFLLITHCFSCIESY